MPCGRWSRSNMAAHQTKGTWLIGMPYLMYMSPLYMFLYIPSPQNFLRNIPYLQIVFLYPSTLFHTPLKTGFGSQRSYRALNTYALVMACKTFQSYLYKSKSWPLKYNIYTNQEFLTTNPTYLNQIWSTSRASLPNKHTYTTIYI
jgi:hypothetical protein